MMKTTGHVTRGPLIALTLVSCWACSHASENGKKTKVAVADDVPHTHVEDRRPIRTGEEMSKKIAQFEPTEIGVDESQIPEEHRETLVKLVKAAEIIDRLFLSQVAVENERWRAEIASDPRNSRVLEYFDIMYGPWDRLDHDKPFWGEAEKPKGASFYPEDLTRDELEAWMASHPDQKEAFKGYFTVVRRSRDGLVTVPYSEAYRDHLEPAARLLEEAAALARDARLAKYLKARARAFRDNEYRESDMDWMDLGDGDLEVVIGPYEVYEDELMGYKAAFETFIALRDPEDSRKLARIKSLIPEMEAYLPIPDELKNPNRGTKSPISVVDVLFTSGDSRAGVQTLAFVLPNDEVVREAKGTKKVMLKNVARAKYEKILLPIAALLLDESQLENVSFEAFFNHTLVHETAHGLGPGKITVTDAEGRRPRATTVNAELKELYAVIEEAKADTLGMYLNYLLIDRGMFEESFKDNMYASFLGGFFRSVRFGANEAHGKANIIQFNYLQKQGAVIRKENGRYAYVKEKMEPAVRSLARELLMIEAKGSYERSEAFIEEFGSMPDHLRAALTTLDKIPTDIRPIYTVETQMREW